MRVRTVFWRIAATAIIAVVPGLTAGAAQAATHHSVRPAVSACATVTVKATPQINTTMFPETIKSKVTSCAATTETVTLVQSIIATGDARAPLAKQWTITLSPGQTTAKTRSYPYSCCGGYSVKDSVRSSAGTQLATAHTTFTFA